jgi:hypothetical protein
MQARARQAAARIVLTAVAAAALVGAAAPRAARAAAYFGDLHAHSALSDDASNPPDAFFRVARDVAGLDFVVLSDHDVFLTDNEWQILKATAASFHVPGRFVAFSAVEWTHRWHMNVYFQRDDESYCTGAGCPEAADFYAFYGSRVLAGEAAAHVNHPADVFKVNWDEIDDRITNAVEVWNTGGAGDNEAGFGNALWALRSGFRLGLVGVSDDHHSDRSPPLLGTGLTGCPADALTRENLLAALRARRCWATNGRRIVLDLQVDGTPMGGELAATLGSRVHAHASADATGSPVEIELLRNGDVVDRVRCAAASCALDSEVRVDEPHTFLYARVSQGDGGRAWSSPVWVHGTCPGGSACLGARLATGGGAPDDDCLTEFLLPVSPAFGPYQRARNRVRCTDGDPTCDFGEEPGECSVRVGLCFGVHDRRRASCAAAVPGSFVVVAPGESTDRATPEFQNRATLAAAFHAATAARELDGCSALNELRVPVGTTELEVESAAGSRVDRDTLTVECVPGRSRRRLPRLAERLGAQAHAHAGEDTAP